MEVRMNILITSIGQRGYLIDHFKESAQGKIGVFAADATEFAPALHQADKAFLLPMAKNSDYYKQLLKICLDNDVKGILSINDLELPILAKYKEELASHGIAAIVSDKEVVDICFDKYKTYQFCIRNGLAVPKTYLWTEKDQLIQDIRDGKMKFPMIAKPRKGSRSVGIHLVHDMKQLIEDIENLAQLDIPEDEKLMFQEYIDSEQYSVHVFNDANFQPVTIVSMVNIFKHFGETFHIKTIKDPALTKLGEDIGNKLKHYGPLSADVHQRENGEYVILEFNPRISGCYSLSHYAGADFPGKIYQLMKNEQIQFDKLDSFDEDVIMLKQFTTYSIKKEQILENIKNINSI
jgi:carbamoyl-phosphate synthase large subunit